MKRFGEKYFKELKERRWNNILNIYDIGSTWNNQHILD